MNKTTAIIVIVVLAIAGYFFFTRDMPAPTPVVENTEEQEQENQQAPVQTPAAPAFNLNGTSYRLTYYNGMAISRGEDYTLSFDSGRLSAKFCNDMSGAYTLTGKTLKAGSMVSTLKLCTLPKYLSDIEALFSKLMSEGANISVVGSTLVIGNGQDTLTFAAVTQ